MDKREWGQAIDWKTGAAMAILLAACVGVGWLILRYALGIAIPFLLAWLLSRAVKPLVQRICGRSRLPRGVVAGTLVVLLVSGTLSLAVAGVRRGVRELENLAAELAADSDGLVSTVNGILDKARSLSSHLPILRRFEDTPGYADFCARLDTLVADGTARLVETVTNRLPDAAVSVASWVPSAFLFITVMLLACYYFSADDGRLGRGAGAMAVRWMPENLRDVLPPLWRRFCRLSKQYVRAYLLLGLLTFLEMFIGLAILGVRYAFILAWLIALVDFLPLLGTGVVLLPWAVISLLMGKTKMAIGLLILYGVNLLIRQLAEPHIVGKGLGLHPLISLIAVYAGWKLFGLVGMIFAPLAVAMIGGAAGTTAETASKTV